MQRPEKYIESLLFPRMSDGLWLELKLFLCFAGQLIVTLLMFMTDELQLRTYVQSILQWHYSTYTLDRWLLLNRGKAMGSNLDAS